VSIIGAFAPNITGRMQPQFVEQAIAVSACAPSLESARLESGQGRQNVASALASSRSMSWGLHISAINPVFKGQVGDRDPQMENSPEKPMGLRRTLTLR
jgi:hypothetical protein